MTGLTLEAGADTGVRPILAPHVRVIGELPGNGFTSRQWLIERDAQFIQVSSSFTNWPSN